MSSRGPMTGRNSGMRSIGEITHTAAMARATLARRGSRSSLRRRRKSVTHAGRKAARSRGRPGGRRRANRASTAHEAASTPPATMTVRMAIPATVAVTNPRPVLPVGSYELDLEAIAVLQVTDLGSAGDGVAVEGQRRPAVLCGLAHDAVELRGRFEGEGEVVEPGPHAAVEHAGHHVAGLLEGEGEAAGVAVQQHPVEGPVESVAEL